MEEKVLNWEGGTYRVSYEGGVPKSAVRVTPEGDMPVDETLLITLDLDGSPA